VSRNEQREVELHFFNLKSAANYNTNENKCERQPDLPTHTIDIQGSIDS
jgi:hypothetical protein